MLGTHYREELAEPVAREFDALYATIRAKFYLEHNEDGSHRDGTDGDVSVMTGNSGLRIKTGPFTLDDVNATDKNVAGIRPNDLAAGTYNNFSPPGIHTAVLIDLEPSGAVTITGIDMGTVLQKRLLKFRNRDSGSVITFPHDNSGSFEQNRFENPGGKSFYLGPHQTVELLYDPERKRLSPVVGPLLVAGVYTPEITNGANVSGSTAYECQYMRMNDVVHVSGRLDVDPTAGATNTKLELSLPFTATFSADRQLAGTMVSLTTVADPGPIYANSSSGLAQFDWTTNNTGNHAIYFTFMYRIP